MERDNVAVKSDENQLVDSHGSFLLDD
jgi:hypothetical protein